MEEIIKEIIDDNPEIRTYKKLEGTLTIEKTYSKPVIHSEFHNIKQLQAKINKINGVISLWEDKKKPYQEIINKYNELNQAEIDQQPKIDQPEEFI